MHRKIKFNNFNIFFKYTYKYSWISTANVTKYINVINNTQIYSENLRVPGFTRKCLLGRTWKYLPLNQATIYLPNKRWYISVVWISDLLQLNAGVQQEILIFLRNTFECYQNLFGVGYGRFLVYLKTKINNCN